jgi:hypothetical protein
MLGRKLTELSTDELQRALGVVGRRRRRPGGRGGRTPMTRLPSLQRFGRPRTRAARPGGLRPISGLPSGTFSSRRSITGMRAQGSRGSDENGVELGRPEVSCRRGRLSWRLQRHRRWPRDCRRVVAPASPANEPAQPLHDEPRWARRRRDQARSRAHRDAPNSGALGGRACGPSTGENCGLRGKPAKPPSCQRSPDEKV